MTASSAPAARPSRPGDAGSRNSLTSVALFGLSMITLTAEIVQLRVFSFSVNPVFVYMVISVALLGFGLSGALLTVTPRLRNVAPEAALGICLLGFGIGNLFANHLFAHYSHLIKPSQGITLISSTALLFASFTIPYFFSGLGVAMVLLSDSASVGRNYFINLAGSAAGCFIVYPFLDLLGAEYTILLVSVVCVLAGTAVTWRHTSALRPVLVAATGALLLASAFGWAHPTYQPDSTDLYASIRAGAEKKLGQPIEPVRRFSRWDPVGRIELFEFPGPFGLFAGKAPAYFFAQDAGAGSVVLGLAEHPDLAEDLTEATIYGLASSLRPGGQTAIIGLGGGPDLIAAMTAGAGHVTGVEINAAVIESLNINRAFMGLPPAGDERMTLQHADGRAFLRRIEDRFDVIQMTGADTFAAGAVSGSLLSEDYLYTLEAIDDFLRALRSDGILQITRFGQAPLRVLTTVVTALEQIGVEHPERNIVVIHQGLLWSATLARKTPFTAKELAQLNRMVRESEATAPSLTLPMYDPALFAFNSRMLKLVAPDGHDDNAPAKGMRSFMEAVQTDSTDAWYAEQSLDFTPCTDDRPFFGQRERFTWAAFREVFTPSSTGAYGWSLIRYVGLLIQFALISFILIVGPLLALRGAGGSTLKRAAPISLAFFSVGVGFMLVEVGLMQKLTLYVGHPNYAVSAVLFSILLSSGVGSYVSGRMKVSAVTLLTVAVVAIIIGVAAFSLFGQDLLRSTLHLSVGRRIVIAIVAMSPLGFFMGFPFPTMLARVETTTSSLSPWAYGVNGFASVLASLAAIPLSIGIGFTGTFQVGALTYLLALGAFALADRQTS